MTKKNNINDDKKKFWIAFGILLVIVIGGVWLLNMNSSHNEKSITPKTEHVKKQHKKKPKKETTPVKEDKPEETADPNVAKDNITKFFNAAYNYDASKQSRNDLINNMKQYANDESVSVIYPNSTNNGQKTSIPVINSLTSLKITPSVNDKNDYQVTVETETKGRSTIKSGGSFDVTVNKDGKIENLTQTKMTLD